MSEIFEVHCNPFSDEYMEQEVEFYGLQGYDRDGVKVIAKRIEGRCDDYLNVNFRTGSPPCPILFIDGHLWMSLSFMELQSSFVPIQLANGRVATSGLGLGYFTLHAMASTTVDTIDVYEREPRVIEFFRNNFSHREGFEKATFIQGDTRELMRDKEYEFVFMDIYDSLLGDEVLTDAELFISTNDIQHYHFWGVEKLLLEAVTSDIIEICELPWHVVQLLRHWMEDQKRLSLHQVRCNEEFLAEGVETLRKLGLL